MPLSRKLLIVSPLDDVRDIQHGVPVVNGSPDLQQAADDRPQRVDVALGQRLIAHTPAPVFVLAAFVVLLCSIGVKLYMAFYNTRYGKRYNSSAMLATAKDSLFDCITSGAVLLSMALNHFWGLNADPWCSLAVSLLILWGGYGTAKDTVDLLLGKKADPELLQSIADTVTGHEGVMGVHDLIVHDYGPGRMMITLHAEVDEEADMLATHDLIDNIEWELNKKFNCLSTIHSRP